MKKILAILLLCLAPAAFGELLRTPYPGVRATGMGNAFLAISDDADALWYNPAGLARVKGYHASVIDMSMGVDSLDTLSRIGGALFGGDYNGMVRTDRQWMQLGFRPTFTMPYFSISLFNRFNGFLEMNNLETLDANVDIFAFNDLGLAAGFGIPLGPYVSIGATTRLFQRTGIDTRLTALDLINELGVPSTNDVMAAAFDKIYELSGAGLGIGVDLGVMASVPLPNGYPRWTLAAVMNDFGMTTFRGIGLNAPKPVRPSAHFGTAVQYDLGLKKGSFNLALDVRNCFESVPFVKQVNLGVEYKHKYFALRGGFSQGYPTGGFSVLFPPHTRLHFSTYSVELGSKLWERAQRMYMLQFVIGFNPI